MFLVGPFLRLPFMDAVAGDGSRASGTATSSSEIVASTSWDEMLAADTAPMLYLATLEPWALADRS